MVYQILSFLLVSLVIFVSIALVLIVWPAKSKDADKGQALIDFHSFFAKRGDVQPAEAQFFTARDGAERLFRLYGQGDELLIFFHGSSSETRYLAPFASRLAEMHGMMVATLDMRGHGSHPGRRGDVDYVDQQDHDTADLASFLREKYGWKKLYVGGHSSGGGMALRYGAGDVEPRPDGLLLVAPFVDVRSPAARRDSGGWAVPRIPRYAGIEMLHRLGIHFFDGLKVLRFAMPPEGHDGLETLEYSWRMYKSITLNNDWEGDLAKIVCPIFVIGAKEDSIFRAEGYQEIFEGNPKATVHLEDGVTHFEVIMSERTPELCHAWLKGLKVGSV